MSKTPWRAGTARLACIAAALTAVPVLAGWVGESASDTGAVYDVSCATISGTAELVIPWSHSVATTTINSTEVQFGAQWNGAYTYNCNPYPSDQPIATTATQIFDWEWLSGTGKKIQVELDVNATANGAATRNAPQYPDWWWSPTVRLWDDKPTVKWKKGNGQTVDVGFATEADGYDPVQVTGVGGSMMPTSNQTLNAGVVADPGRYSTGAMDSTTGNINGGSTDDKVEVNYKQWGVVNRTADNANVASWSVLLLTDLTSSVVK